MQSQNVQYDTTPDKESTDNWQGFCRAYGRQFNISYAAAICEAGPAWKVYKNTHGLKFKYEKKDALPMAATPTTSLMPPPRRSTVPENLMKEKKKMLHRKEGKRPREEESSEEEEGGEKMEEEGEGDTITEEQNEMYVTPTVTRVPMKVPPPAPKKRRVQKRRENMEGQHFYSPYAPGPPHPHMPPGPPLL